MKPTLIGFLILLAVIGFGFVNVGLTAQASPPQAEIERNKDKGEGDKATAPLRVVIPSNAGTVKSDSNNVEDEGDFIDEPGKTTVSVDDSPKFFGEPVEGHKFVWVLDYSGSMANPNLNRLPIEDLDGNVIVRPTPLDSLKLETIGAISGLGEDDE